jgi:hypothetical protein
MDKKFLMKVVQVKLYCDDCEVELQPDGQSNGAYMTINYHYKCPCCGKCETRPEQYPKTEFIPTTTPVITK